MPGQRPALLLVGLCAGARAELGTSVCPASTHGSGHGCVAVLVSTDVSVCHLAANETCRTAVDNKPTPSCSTADAGTVEPGFMWGMLVSIIGDIIISIGLALQKVAHNRLKRLGEASTSQNGHNGSRDAQKPSHNVLKVPIWWAGIVLTVGGEVGNFAAYGDPSTPASVVTAVGCVGVIANSFIATVFLKEPLRRRDVLGSSLVVFGVVLVVVFAPQQPCPLTAGRFYELLSQPAAIIMLVFMALVISTLAFLTPKFGDRHVLWNLSQASLIGSLTVMSSKAVSTFIVLTVEALFDPAVPFSDQISSSLDNPESCGEAGHHWGAVKWEAGLATLYGCIVVDPYTSAVNFTEGATTSVIASGQEQLTEAGLYVCLLVLIVTGVAQVKYINKGMQLFDQSEVIPCHYVTFTLFSIIGTSIFYQEFAVDEPIELHYFLDGCAMTFIGVYLITSNRKTAKDMVETVMDDTPVSEDIYRLRWSGSNNGSFKGDGGNKPLSPATVEGVEGADSGDVGVGGRADLVSSSELAGQIDLGLGLGPDCPASPVVPAASPSSMQPQQPVGPDDPPPEIDLADGAGQSTSGRGSIASADVELLPHERFEWLRLTAAKNRILRDSTARMGSRINAVFGGGQASHLYDRQQQNRIDSPPPDRDALEPACAHTPQARRRSSISAYIKAAASAPDGQGRQVAREAGRSRGNTVGARPQGGGVRPFRAEPVARIGDSSRQQPIADSCV